MSLLYRVSEGYFEMYSKYDESKESSNFLIGKTSPSRVLLASSLIDFLRASVEGFSARKILSFVCSFEVRARRLFLLTSDLIELA